MLILEKFTDTWNYTFIIMAIISILSGTMITLKQYTKAKKETKEIDRREKRKSRNVKSKD